MESIGGSSNLNISAGAMSAGMQSNVADTGKATNYEFDPSLAEEEKRFYVKAYPTVDIVRDRKTHCTVCKTHIGTAPVHSVGLKMHPILRVSHCNKCHDFYNSGEFEKGEDGSELYCRWCGQGGEVYCCSSCPYVFCKSCIVKNLSKGVVADIEQNENWNCFSCAPKILWPLRAQHWALINYIEQQKKEIYSLNMSEQEIKQYLARDASKCCRLAKAKAGNMSDSMESLDSVNSKRSHGSTSSAKKPMKHSASPHQINAAKRAKPNDEVVCTPDLLSMLEPDCQITVSQKSNNRPMQSPSAPAAKIMSIQQPGGIYQQMSSTPKSTAPPPLVLRNTAIKLRPAAPQPVVRRTIIGPRAPTPGGNGSPVYHTINGYRIDLNSAAQQETFRLPNGKLIQVKRQGPPGAVNNPPHSSPSTNSWQQQMNNPQPQRIIPQTIASRPVQITQHPYNITIQQQQQHQQIGGPQPMRQYHNSMIGSTTINSINQNGTSIQVLNGQMNSAPQQQQQQQTQQMSGPVRPVMIRHVFPDSPIGQARTGLQEQVFNAMEICTHLTNKVQTLTNSNAYKQARNYLEVKELYIHLSYLLTYAIGRFKGLQDKCLGDMRTLGFGNDADSLENGQLAAAVDYVCYGQLDDVDLFNTGANSFHNQVYEYRKSLHANLKDGEDGAKSPLPPLFPLGEGKSDDVDDEDIEGEDSLLEEPKGGLKGHWLEGGNDSPAQTAYNQENEENEEPDESYMDNDDDEGFSRSMARGGGFGDSFMQGTEESMRKNEETHAFDRKLTRLVAQYPSIWCIRHPDYGNFEVTRKQWRTIQSHFDRNEQIKLRWKNIRKRFVRIEKRIAEGKRFNGHFDKAMAFLANRELPEDQWVQVDCGEDDGDTYERCNLDAIEQSLHLQGKDEFVDRNSREREKERNLFNFQPAVKPIDIEPLDLKIMSFVKSNPVVWRKSMDPEADKIDEQTRKTVWNQLQRSIPHVSTDYIKDRWQHLYEMYKTFRLKTIKSHDDRANLELKYSKYLAKLYFLYKIDEHELKNENNGLFEDCFELEEDEEAEREAAEEEGFDAATSPKAQEPQTKLQDMPDDKEFLIELIKFVREYPAIWDTHHEDYNDIMIRDNYWQEINEKLQDFKHKQASDDEDNEIEIVEPKTDLINLDSDDDEPPASSPVKKQVISPVKATKGYATSPIDVKMRPPIPAQITRVQAVRAIPQTHAAAPSAPSAPQASDENMDLMSMAQSFLASMLEVDIYEGSGSVNYPGSDASGAKKQPRKKLTNKPNPTLLKQKAIMERERLEEMKRNDQKLKMKCAVELKKAEDEFPYAKEMLEAKAKQKELREKEKLEKEERKKLMINTGKEMSEDELIIGDDDMNSSTEEKNKETTDKLKENKNDEGADKDTENSEESLEEPKDKSIEIVEKDKDSSIEMIESEEEEEKETEKEKETETELDKSLEIIETATEKSNDNGKEKSDKVVDEVKDKSEEISDEIKEKSDKVQEDTKCDDDKDISESEEMKDTTDNKCIKEIKKKSDEIIDDEEKDKSHEVEEKSVEETKEKSMEVDGEEQDKSVECLNKEEEIAEKEKSEKLEDEIIDEESQETTFSGGDEIMEKMECTEVNEKSILDKTEIEDSVEKITDVSMNNTDKVEEEEEDDKMETNEKAETPELEKETPEPMEQDDEETPQESNTIREESIDAINEVTENVKELDVDKEIEKILENPTDTVKDIVKDTVTDAVTDTDTVKDTVTDTVKDTVKDTVEDTVKDTVTDKVTDTLTDTLMDTVSGLEEDNSDKTEITETPEKEEEDIDEEEEDNDEEEEDNDEEKEETTIANDKDDIISTSAENILPIETPAVATTDDTTPKEAAVVVATETNLSNKEEETIEPPPLPPIEAECTSTTIPSNGNTV